MKVNLFDFATKELSQDAFLLWLVSNADKHCQEDESLHKVAQGFVRALIGPYNKEIISVKVEKQWKHIDVAFSVNDDVFVIIEDKAGACLHGDQLERYQNDAIERAGHEDRTLKCVYFNSKNPVAWQWFVVKERRCHGLEFRRGESRSCRMRPEFWYDSRIMTSVSA